MFMLVKKIFSFQDICKISKHLYLAMGLYFESQKIIVVPSTLYFSFYLSFGK